MASSDARPRWRGNSCGRTSYRTSTANRRAAVAAAAPRAPPPTCRRRGLASDWRPAHCRGDEVGPLSAQQVSLGGNESLRRIRCGGPRWRTAVGNQVQRCSSLGWCRLGCDAYLRRHALDAIAEQNGDLRLVLRCDETFEGRPPQVLVGPRCQRRCQQRSAIPARELLRSSVGSFRERI